MNKTLLINLGSLFGNAGKSHFSNNVLDCIKFIKFQKKHLT